MPSILSNLIKDLVINGDDVPKIELIRSLHYTRVEKIVCDLRCIYKENPGCMVPTSGSHE